MRQLLPVRAAVALTIPVFLGLTKIDAIPSWLYRERGYAVLAPLFRMFGAVGVEGHEDVVVGVLMVTSFVIALAIACGGSALWRELAVRVEDAVNCTVLSREVIGAVVLASSGVQLRLH